MKSLHDIKIDIIEGKIINNIVDIRLFQDANKEVRNLAEFCNEPSRLNVTRPKDGLKELNPE